MELQTYQYYLEASAARHSHLCPRQVLGVRIALAGAAELGLSVPRQDHRLLVIVETDGCFTDAVQVVTGVSVGQRTLRIEDYGKVAATFIDLREQRAVRITPRTDARQRAMKYMPEEHRHYFAQLRAYEHMEDAELLSVEWVTLRQPLAAIIGRAGVRVNCMRCGEEILNGREVRQGPEVLCRACAEGGYYVTGRPA